MIKLRKKENSLKTYRCCSDYAIEYVVPSILRILNNKYVIYKTAEELSRKILINLDILIIKKAYLL